MKCIKRLWILISLLALAIVLFTISINSPDPNTNRHLAQVLCAGALFSLTSVPLVVECYFYFRSQRSDITSAFSLLAVTIYIFILLGGACFKLWGEWMPYAGSGILVVMYIVTVIWFMGYFFGWWGKTHLGNWDVLKGFGGTTFAEFAGGVGILVSIGIYLVYTTNLSSFWWAAQLAAMISLFSAAAWVQRYVLEKPLYPEGRKGETAFSRFMKTGPNFLNSITALCTMLAVLFPTEKNRNGMEAALGEDTWWILGAWITVILFWLVASILPFFKTNWPANPQSKSDDSSLASRKTIRLFLMLILLILVVSLGFVVILFTSGESIWSSAWSKWAAIIAAAFFVLGILLKWVVDKYVEEENSILKMLMIFRDIALLGCGVVILIVQISGVGDPASPLSTLYKFILGMMSYSTLIGILIGAYKWSSKRQLRQPTSI